MLDLRVCSVAAACLQKDVLLEQLRSDVSVLRAQHKKNAVAVANAVGLRQKCDDLEVRESPQLMNLPKTSAH